MNVYRYIVSVECASNEQADTVMSERLDFIEDYGFEYRVAGYRLTEVVHDPEPVIDTIPLF